MAYLGRTQLKASDIKLKAATTISGSSTNTVVLTWTAPHEQSLIFKVNGVTQNSTDFSIAGSPTTITLASGNFADGSVVEVVGINDIGTAIVPADGSVTRPKLATSGTPDGSKFLQDDMAWTTVDSLPSQTSQSGKFLTTNGTSASWATAGGTNTPSFGAYLTADQGLTSDLWTKITMDAEEWDTGGGFDHITDYQFKVPSGEAGKYFISFTSTGSENDASGEDFGSIKLAIYKGGSAFKQAWFDGAGARHQWRCGTITAVLDLAVDDEIEFYASMESNGGPGPEALGGQSMTFCSGFKLL